MNDRTSSDGLSTHGTTTAHGVEPVRAGEPLRTQPLADPDPFASGAFASGPRGFLEDHHLERVEGWLDTKFRLPVIGYRFGLDGLIGLIPGVGDGLTAATSAVFIADAWKMGARKRVMGRMLVNVGLDFAVGLVPVVGDLLDFAFKSNVKNLALLREERARLREEHAARST